jgi:hypothetical protein
VSKGVRHVTPDGFRLAAPVRARDDAWVVEGWSATRWVQGEEPDRPTVLDTRHDWSARADRAVWGEHAIEYRPEFDSLARRLWSALVPLGGQQIVHADLTGNVLFASGLPPAIIDISPLLATARLH